jgi:uncharacterized protein (DUF2267 family)
MLVRGLYYEGWNPSATAAHDRSLASFVSRVDQEMARAMSGEAYPIGAEEAIQAVLRVLSDHVSPGELDQVRHVLPERVRALWPV